MSNYLDALLDRVGDPNLSTELRREIDRLKDAKQFGLVFERHLPETVRLHSHPVRRGLSVQDRAKPSDATTWTVQKVTAGEATVVRYVDGEPVVDVRPVSELVVVRRFGEPMYPGLKSVDRLERCPGKPFHAVINAENYHALETMLYAFEGQIDACYIDPPYNSGAKDWRYNNNYVDADDAYRHSKWLSFMEKRLRLAKRLLNPANSALIVTIDEKEYLRLGMLLTDVFPDARMQMISSVINPAGAGRDAEYSRTDEYIFVVRIGDCRIMPEQRDEERRPVTWDTLRRSDLSSVRRTRPAQFYPIYVNTTTGRIEAVGEALPHDMDRADAPQRDGCVAVFPVRPDGTEMNWGITAEPTRERLADGYIRAGARKANEPQEYVISYLTKGIIDDIDSGRVTVSGRQADGSVIAHYVTGRLVMPSTAWNLPSHDAQRYGTGIVKPLVPGRRFPFPKSLYAVEDVLRHVVGDKPDALVLDFFAGSGTTTHAVMRLNRQDGGRRRSVIVTNNEVGVTEAKTLTERGLLPGDPEWEERGIAQFITFPRIRAAVTGVDHEGQPVKGEYRFVDESPMSDGFEENVEFFDLTYEDRDRISLGRAFTAIAPILWMKAGSTGPRIDKLPTDKSWVLPEDGTYGILFDVQQWRAFTDAISSHGAVRHAFIITDSVSEFQQVLSELPATVDATMLYEDYLSTFEINTGRGGAA